MDLMTVDSGRCSCGKRLNWGAPKGKGPWMLGVQFFCSEDCATMAAARE